MFTTKGLVRPSRNQIRKQVFTTKDTKSTKFGLSPEGFRPQGGVLIIRNLRVLRAFVVKLYYRSRHDRALLIPNSRIPH
jgi:hypothetical protein